MTKIAQRVLLGIILFSVPATAAHACSVAFTEEQTNARMKVRADFEVERAFAIIDAEVVRPGGFNRGPALLYAHRVFKGPKGPWFEVGTNRGDSCAREFSRYGERMRLFLYRAPDVDGELVAFDPLVEDRFIDRILGSNRRREYPYFPGPRR